MSDLEKPWVERRRSAPPSSCPVCGAATMEVRTAGVITCRTASIDHFEWRPDVGPVVSVPSERADEHPVWCAAADPVTGPCDHEPSADNRRYDNSLTIDVPPGTTHVEITVDPLEGEVMGRDFVETVGRWLHPDGAALASLHRPVYGRPPYCWACTTGGRGHESRVHSGRRAPWPCTTASLALEMMGLTASDIAITEE